MNRIEARLQSVPRNGCRYIDVRGKGVAAEDKGDYRLSCLGAGLTGLQLSSFDMMERDLASDFAGNVPLSGGFRRFAFAHDAIYYIGSKSGFQAGFFLLSANMIKGADFVSLPAAHRFPAAPWAKRKRMAV